MYALDGNMVMLECIFTGYICVWIAFGKKKFYKINATAHYMVTSRSRSRSDPPRLSPIYKFSVILLRAFHTARRPALDMSDLMEKD